MSCDYDLDDMCHCPCKGSHPDDEYTICPRHTGKKCPTCDASPTMEVDPLVEIERIKRRVYDSLRWAEVEDLPITLDIHITYRLPVKVNEVVIDFKMP